MGSLYIYMHRNFNDLFATITSKFSRFIVYIQFNSTDNHKINGQTTVVKYVQNLISLFAVGFAHFSHKMYYFCHKYYFV